MVQCISIPGGTLFPNRLRKPGRCSVQAGMGSPSQVLVKQIWKAVFALLGRSSLSFLLVRKQTFTRCIDLSTVEIPVVAV